MPVSWLSKAMRERRVGGRRQRPSSTNVDVLRGHRSRPRAGRLGGGGRRGVTATAAGRAAGQRAAAGRRRAGVRQQPELEQHEPTATRIRRAPRTSPSATGGAAARVEVAGPVGRARPRVLLARVEQPAEQRDDSAKPRGSAPAADDEPGHEQGHRDRDEQRPERGRRDVDARRRGPGRARAARRRHGASACRRVTAGRLRGSGRSRAGPRGPSRAA